MDKPISMSVKDYLVRIYSVKNMKSERMVDAIISHQFQSINENLDTNDSLEISGFGKFLFNKNKANKTLNKELEKKEFFESQINNLSLSEQKRTSASNKLKDTLETITYIKKKLCLS